MAGRRRRRAPTLHGLRPAAVVRDEAIDAAWGHVERLEADEGARAAYREGLRAPRAVRYLESMAMSAGRDGVVARKIVADVLAEFGDLPDVESSYATIVEAVATRSRIPSGFRVTPDS